MDKFTKQPADVQDYDISYTEWLADLGDTALSLISATITGPDALATIASPAPTLTGGVVKVWVTGGTSGAAYTVTTRLLTAEGRRKEHEIQIKVKEV